MALRKKKKVVVRKKVRVVRKKARAVRKPVRVKKKPAARKKIAKKTGRAALLRREAAKKIISNKFSRGRRKVLPLARVHHNPVLKPTEHSWESRATFNPAAVRHGNKVHILYRAVGEDDRSVLGYAGSDDGYTIERLKRPAYAIGSYPVPRDVIKIPHTSGGGTSGGCEDPRMTIVGDKVYVIYTAFDGWGSLRMAMTSIRLEDFIHKRWYWKQPVLISPPGEIHKNWALFPERINGKYALLHSLSPEIQIAYFDNLDELNGAQFVRSTYRAGAPRKGAWDSWVRGIGPPPIMTKYGWLILYHAMDFRDPNRYKLGAMIVDADDPTKILYRSQEPVLEPDAPYENEGFKSGVVYSCGAVVKNGQLIVYYGGADTVGCIATAPLNAFLDTLVATGRATLARSR